MLAELCDQTFLRLWTYPNPYKDDGHELCDLMVVFDNHVFVFFDREGRHFQNTARDPQLNWERWKREVIDRQVKTASGAERYLRSGRKVFLDAARQKAFPIAIPSADLRVHKIIVAHGAKEACAGFSSDNVYGSLAVGYSNTPGGVPSFPFMVDLTKDEPVHMLDSHNLPIVLSELDTFTDLIAYLEAKTAAIGKYDFLSYCGEEDLLAHYFGNFDVPANRHFIGTREEGINGIHIGEGEWRDFLERPEYKRKKKADKSSRVWDEIVQRTCQNALDGTLLGNASLLKGQGAIQEMAREPRFSRRALSEEMVRAVQKFPETGGKIVRSVSLMPSFDKDLAYVFLQLKVEGRDYDEAYRAKRQALLQIACGAAKNKFPHLKRIVGIGLDAPKFFQETSEDFIWMDCSEWSDARRVEFEQANRDLGFFNSPSLNTRMMTVKNFPDEPSA